MEKIITVGKTAKPKNGYIESLTISGNYLKQNGFEIGDLVKLVVTKNEIRIIKNVNTSLEVSKNYEMNEPKVSKKL